MRHRWRAHGTTYLLAWALLGLVAIAVMIAASPEAIGLTTAETIVLVAWLGPLLAIPSGRLLWAVRPRREIEAITKDLRQIDIEGGN